MIEGRWLRILIILAGLSGFGIIVAEILKKWQFIGAQRNSIWVVGPILFLFLFHELLHSNDIKNQEIVSPQTYSSLSRMLNFFLLITLLLTLISIPFLWFGLIKELAISANR